MLVLGLWLARSYALLGQSVQWGLNLRLLPGAFSRVTAGWVWMNTVFTGTGACPQPRPGSRLECPVRLNVFAFSCSGSSGLGPRQRGLVKALLGAVQLGLSRGWGGHWARTLCLPVSPSRSLPDVPPHWDGSLWSHLFTRVSPR